MMSSRGSLSSSNGPSDTARTTRRAREGAPGSEPGTARSTARRTTWRSAGAAGGDALPAGPKCAPRLRSGSSAGPSALGTSQACAMTRIGWLSLEASCGAKVVDASPLATSGCCASRVRAGRSRPRQPTYGRGWREVCSLRRRTISKRRASNPRGPTGSDEAASSVVDLWCIPDVAMMVAMISLVAARVRAMGRTAEVVIPWLKRSRVLWKRRRL